MKITLHISFFYVEDRIKYLHTIIEETNTYKYLTDIYIHTNNPTIQLNTCYTNGSITTVYHDVSNTNPHYLTWKCRSLLEEQRDDYDIFMYIEDDILVPHRAIEYWLKYHEKLIDLQYNLGFLRIETEDNIDYITDLEEKLDNNIITLGEVSYCVNSKYPYCAFWIYNKKEFNRFVNSIYYDPNNIPNYFIRERSAVGLHGIGTNWYKNTLIPVVNNKLINDCKIYHLQNNYVVDKKSQYASINFDEAINVV